MGNPALQSCWKGIDHRTHLPQLLSIFGTNSAE